MSKSTSTPSRSQNILNCLEEVLSVFDCDVFVVVAVDAVRKNPSRCFCFFSFDEWELLLVRFIMTAGENARARWQTLADSKMLFVNNNADVVGLMIIQARLACDFCLVACGAVMLGQSAKCTGGYIGGKLLFRIWDISIVTKMASYLLILDP